MYEAVAAFIGKLGFPIFVAVVLLFRSDRMLRDMMLILREQTTALKVLANLEDYEDDEEEALDEEEEEE